MAKSAKPKGRPGRPKMSFSDRERDQVMVMAAEGISEQTISRVIGKSRTAIRAHCMFELTAGKDVANGMVAAAMFRKAKGDGPGSVSAGKYWLSCRAGWREASALDAFGQNGRTYGVAEVPADMNADQWQEQASKFRMEPAGENVIDLGTRRKVTRSAG